MPQKCWWNKWGMISGEWRSDEDSDDEDEDEEDEDGIKG